MPSQGWTQKKSKSFEQLAMLATFGFIILVVLFFIGDFGTCLLCCAPIIIVSIIAAAATMGRWGMEGVWRKEFHLDPDYAAEALERAFDERSIAREPLMNNATDGYYEPRARWGVRMTGSEIFIKVTNAAGWSSVSVGKETPKNRALVLGMLEFVDGTLGYR